VRLNRDFFKSDVAAAKDFLKPGAGRNGSAEGRLFEARVVALARDVADKAEALELFADRCVMQVVKFSLPAQAFVALELKAILIGEDAGEFREGVDHGPRQFVLRVELRASAIT
jgi:hypothetical protein